MSKAKAKTAKKSSGKSAVEVSAKHLRTMIEEIIEAGEGWLIQLTADLVATATTVKEKLEENAGVDEDADEVESDEDDADFEDEDDAEEGDDGDEDEEEAEEDSEDEDFEDDGEEADEDEEEEEGDDEEEAEEEDEDPLAGWGSKDFVKAFKGLGLNTPKLLGKLAKAPEGKKTAHLRKITDSYNATQAKFAAMPLKKLIDLAKSKKIAVKTTGLKSNDDKVDAYATALAVGKTNATDFFAKK